MLHRVEHKQKSQKHLISALLLLILPSATLFVVSLSLAALPTVGKLGVWPSARAEEERTDHSEVSH